MNHDTWCHLKTSIVLILCVLSMHVKGNECVCREEATEPPRPERLGLIHCEISALVCLVFLGQDFSTFVRCGHGMRARACGTSKGMFQV